MDKQAQDKRWNELSEESKKFIRNKYDEIIKEANKPENQKLDDEEADGNIRELWGKQAQLIELFGYDNLNPKPPTPKTWEDVEKAEGGDIRVDSKVINPNGRAWGLGLKYHQKAEATLKLAILIDLGYGGMVSEEEALDDNIEKSAIDLYEGKIQLHTGICIARGDRFLMFRSNEMGEEFMSHQSNRKLVEQYYMR